MSERIDAFARRIEGDPYYLASALAAYARAEGLSEADLAKRLGCLPAQLPAIRLCRKPHPAPARFQHDVDRIAGAFEIDGGVIAEAVRLADVLITLGAVDESSAFLMAARDRAADDVDEASEGDDQP